MSEFPAAPSVAPGASVREEFIERQKYPPVGACIYCGSDGGRAGLTSEHIVPFSLGGNAEILEASCADCAKITSQLERHLARNIFWELRIHTNTQTRRPKERPSVLPARVSIGKRHDKLMLPIQDHGLTGFRRLVLPDLILGKYPCVAYYVGCELANPPPPHERKFVHGMNISEMTIERLRFLLVSVRLFANSGTAEHGTPIYRIVVGAPRLPA